MKASFGFGVFTVSLAALLALLLAWALGLRMNLSASIAPGIYQLEAGAPTRGTVVLACLPRMVAAFGRRRGYIPRGSCDDGNAPVGKTVVAVAGDTVVVDSDAVRVNGRTLTRSRPLRADARGRALSPKPAGEYVLHVGEIWLLSTYSPHSFDSRYYGAIPTSRVVSRMRRIENIGELALLRR